MLYRLIATWSILGELIVIRYVAESITNDCRIFQLNIDFCQLCIYTKLFARS